MIQALAWVGIAADGATSGEGKALRMARVGRSGGTSDGFPEVIGQPALGCTVDLCNGAPDPAQGRRPVAAGAGLPCHYFARHDRALLRPGAIMPTGRRSLRPWKARAPGSRATCGGRVRRPLLTSLTLPGGSAVIPRPANWVSQLCPVVKPPGNKLAARSRILNRAMSAGYVHSELPTRLIAASYRRLPGRQPRTSREAV